MKKQTPTETAAGRPAAVVDPGRKATPAEMAEWNAEIVTFLRAVEAQKLNVHGAADYLATHPLSREAIAWLAWRAHDIFRRLEQRQRASRPRTNSLQHAIRLAGVTSYAQVKDKAPHLLQPYTKQQITQAIAKAKQKK